MREFWNGYTVFGVRGALAGREFWHDERLQVSRLVQVYHVYPVLRFIVCRALLCKRSEERKMQNVKDNQAYQVCGFPLLESKNEGVSCQ